MQEVSHRAGSAMHTECGERKTRLSFDATAFLGEME